MTSVEKSEKATVLIVDDSRTVRVSLSLILRDHFTVIEAEDGEDGWEKLQENSHTKLIITDISMPKLDGYGLICRVRGASPILSKIPIVVITSKEDEITRERAHACGANNFIVKPAETSDLLDTVKFHTEHNLASGKNRVPAMEKYGKNIENKVLETPDFDEALEIINHPYKDSLEPYAAIELAIKILPLLEFCNKSFDMDVTSEIDSLKSKLKSA